ncbi:hypothetical protein ACFOW4_15910 [Micromonospora sp. GCM10011542]|uniref:hypothetical protein n=1 Tax=Micromonospora sp. GCM10011542 TaxID=3317337 RepID=UPI003618EDBE
MRRPLLLLVVAVLALAGCGREPTRQADAAGVARELTLTLDRGDDGYDEVLDYWRQVNDSLVRCMADGGLTFQPYVDQWAVDRRTALGLSREEFARRYGYGLTTLIDYLPPGVRRVDPNLTALAWMTDERRTSYQSRLASCRRDARQRFGPAPHVDTSAMTAEEGDRRDEILAAVDRDPRVVRAAAERTRCIEAKGFASADSRSLALSQAAERYRDSFERAALAAEQAGRDSAGLRLTDVFGAAELAELKRLQQREIAEARQVGPCQWAYDDSYQVVYREHLARVGAAGS